MTTKRFLPGALLVVFTACPAVAQFAGSPYSAPRPYTDTIPSVAPVAPAAASAPVVAGAPTVPSGVMPAYSLMPSPGTTPPYAGIPPYGAMPSYGATQPYGATPPGTMPTGPTPFATSLDRVSTPIQQNAGNATSPFAALTGQAVQPPSAPIPPGSYPGTGWTGSGIEEPYHDCAGCCGPLGRDGPIGTEIYVDNGPTIPFGQGPFVARLEVGWMVGAGGRALWFNQARDAAWVTDLGWSYEYNRGNQYAAINLDIRQPQVTSPTTGALVNVPDILQSVVVRDIDRNSFNYGLGRDWWCYGPGSTGTEQSWNLRYGALVGGRYGTAHVDLISTTNPFEYFRRQNVYEGLFLEVHANVEVPLGTVILVAGIKAQYGYDWTNLAPPVAGDIQSANVLLSAGFRY